MHPSHLSQQLFTTILWHGYRIEEVEGNSSFRKVLHSLCMSRQIDPFKIPCTDYVYYTVAEWFKLENCQAAAVQLFTCRSGDM